MSKQEDIRVGESMEQEVISRLNNKPLIHAYKSRITKNKNYDLIIVFESAEIQTFTGEVKFDKMATKTGNVANSTFQHAAVYASALTQTECLQFMNDTNGSIYSYTVYNFSEGDVQTDNLIWEVLTYDTVITDEIEGSGSYEPGGCRKQCNSIRFWFRYLHGYHEDTGS